MAQGVGRVAESRAHNDLLCKMFARQWKRKVHMLSPVSLPPRVEARRQRFGRQLARATPHPPSSDAGASRGRYDAKR